MLRLPYLALLLAWACDADTASKPNLELYVGGALTVTAPTIAFGEIPLGSTTNATFELKNLGPGPVRLTGTPPMRLERDDKLAFRVLQPASTDIPAGTTLPVEVRFVPTVAGPTTARVLIAAAHLDEPISVLLTGTAQVVDLPDLAITLGGEPPPVRHDFGSVAPDSATSITLRLANRGTAPMSLGANPITLSDTASAFVLGAFDAMALAPGVHVDIALSFAPRTCGPFAAALTIAVPTFAVTTIELRGQGGDNPMRVLNATDTAQLRAPDLAVAVSDPVIDDRRRIAIGNLTVGTFAGQVSTLGWDECVANQARVLSATSSGLTATLFGNTVGLTDDGRVLLITGRDQRKDAWLFALDPDGTARFLATLLTFEEAFGHGRGAAISGDGTAAFVGQTGATSGLNNHGAVFAYRRSGSTWVSQPEATMKLVPSNSVRVELVGAWVATDSGGDLVVSGALATPIGANTSGPALAYVWPRQSGGDPGEWGLAIDGGEPNQRRETQRLLTNEVPGDSAARVAISGDASLVAISVATPETTKVHLFERIGDDWGLPTATSDERIATAVLTFDTRPELRFALGSAGDLLVFGDTSGVGELARPSDGWLDRLVSPDSPPDRQWSAPVYSQLALSPDESTLVGVGVNGTAWVVAR